MPDDKVTGRYIGLPQWLRDELQNLMKKQIDVARQMQARLIDTDRQHEGKRGQTKVPIDALLQAVQAMDRLTRHLDTMCGGTRVLRESEDDMRHTMMFYAYCEREAEYLNKQAKKARK